MILKAGTYRFNDVPILTNDLSQNIFFEVGDILGIQISVVLDNTDSVGNIFQSISFTREDGESFAVFVNVTQNVSNVEPSIFWQDEVLKTINILEDTEVDDTFGAWFISNTNYNEVNAKPLAEITYNGKTIAQLNAGETATLSCKDKKMASDVVVKVDRVIIPKGDVTFNENGSFDVANKSTAIVDVPTIIDVTELPTNPKDTDTRSIYRCNGKLYVVDEFGAGTTWRIDNTRTGTMEIDGMAYWDIPFESNGETFSNFGITRGDSTNSFCHIDYNGSRVYTATAKSQGTWTNENYRTVRLLKNVSSGYHSLGSWLSANGERLTNVWVEYIKPEGTLELVFNNIEAEFPIDCSQYAKVTVNTAEPLKISDPTVLDNITDTPYGVGGNVFLYEGATTDSYEKGALYYLEDTDK